MTLVTLNSSTITLREQGIITDRMQQPNISHRASSIITSSSLSPAQTESQGFLPFFSNWISSIIDYVQKSILYFTRLFTNTTPRQIPTSEPMSDGVPHGDDLFLTNMQNKLDNGTRIFPDQRLDPDFPPLSPSSFTIPLTQRQVIEALGAFSQIQRPIVKI